MPELKTWRVRDGGGAPDPTATPAFIAFVDRAGAALTPQPAIVNLGQGEFGFRGNASQENLGFAYLVDNGPAAFTRYEFGQVYSATTLPLAALLFTYPNGTLWDAGGTPTVPLYTDPVPAPRTPPVPVSIQGNPQVPDSSFWFISASQADIDAGGTAYVVDPPFGAMPESYDGALAGQASLPPVVTPGGTLVDVTGVLEVGGVRAGDVPVNPRVQLNLVIGTSFTLRFRCVRTDGSAVVGGTFEFSVAKRTGDSFRPIKKTATAAHSVNFTVAPSETKSLSVGWYAWDVWYIDNLGNRSPVLPPSPLKLEAPVTPPP